MSHKVCFKCKRNLPLDCFYKHKQMSDGHLGKCKECTKADAIGNRLAKIEYYRSYDRMRGSQPHRVSARAEYAKTDAYAASHKKSLANYKARHPKRRAAQIVVGNAIRDGKLIPWPCMICGCIAEAHHPDYDRPLDVVWLCSTHHKAAHKLARNHEASKAQRSENGHLK